MADELMRFFKGKGKGKGKRSPQLRVAGMVSAAFLLFAGA